MAISCLDLAMPEIEYLERVNKKSLLHELLLLYVKGHPKIGMTPALPGTPKV